VEATVEKLGLAPPSATFFKGADFKGMLFCKFKKAEEATKALNVLNKAKLDYEGHEIRCKPDAPIEERVPLSLLLGLRWQLGEWGFNKKDIKVDGDGHVTMTVADKTRGLGRDQKRSRAFDIARCDMARVERSGKFRGATEAYDDCKQKGGASGGSPAERNGKRKGW
jgi:hypothetical protein